ncbi:MAG: lysophospholipase, partial [Oscillospiraceae bacterium]|nr:lysophospholipase [Oscillospiraceae bacterium]
LRCMTEHAGKARIVLIAPPPMRFGDWVQTQELINESMKLGGLYRRVAHALGVAFADAGEWGVALTFDGVHFSPEGHAAFAAGLSKALERL